MGNKSKMHLALVFRCKSYLLTLLFKLTNSENETLTDTKICFTCMKAPDSYVEKQSERIFSMASALHVNPRLWSKSSLVQPDICASRH